MFVYKSDWWLIYLLKVHDCTKVLNKNKFVGQNI